ncbi:hypothetical protein Pr1d_42600 [Bythopirellula goksoeyrii]|uniref:CsbD-like domain-containing protein n=1 Tax=Bythopirellula goksoeyrii TaxID=1400387 RepID=A0A5B9QH72_9BACT|nr:hypothetical protein Pr1d_42600 [Bythopirellula goksoeyrii]
MLFGPAGGENAKLHYLSNDINQKESAVATQEQLTGNWKQLKGLIKEHWGQLTDDELQEVQGDLDQLVGLIQQKTGLAKAKIQSVVEDLSEQCTGVFGHAKEVAREYMGQANESVSDAAEQMRERVREGYSGAEQLVQRRPAESVAVAFGTGLIAGVIVGLVLRSR